MMSPGEQDECMTHHKANDNRHQETLPRQKTLFVAELTFC